MTITTTVTIVRHGETDYNKAGIIQGHLDIPLNLQGEAQAAVAGRWFEQQQSGAGERWTEAWSSDLKRARKVRLFPPCFLDVSFEVLTDAL